MNAQVKTKFMDWSKFSVEEWLKQYGAYLATCRMKSGNAPDNLGVNQIYWLVRQNEPGAKSHGKYIYLQIGDFEAECIEKMLGDIRTSKRVCESAKVAIELFIQKSIRGLTLDQMDDEFTLSRSSINNMVYAGKFYMCGHDKRLRID